MMDREKLKQQASQMSEAELHNCLEWQQALAEHFHDSFDFTMYNAVTIKVQIIEDELKRRE